MKAYTIGNAEWYDPRLAQDVPTMKLGYRAPTPPEPGRSGFPPYPGGWVWKTYEEAEEFRVLMREDSYGVYEIELAGPWETVVSSEPDKHGQHNLLVDARVVRRVP